MLLAVACFATVICVLVLLTFREKPGSPIFSSAKTDDKANANRDSTVNKRTSSVLSMKELGMKE